MTAAGLRALLLGLAVLVLAGGAAIVVNLLLLDRAASQNDPIGRLSPAARVLPEAPRWTVRPVDAHPEDRGADD